jgi:hypothetical protein
MSGSRRGVGLPVSDTANTDLLGSQLGLEKADLRLVLAELDRRAAQANKQLRVLATNYFDPFSVEHMDCIDYVNGTDTLVTLNEVNWLRNGLTSLDANIASEVTYAKGVGSHLNVSLVDISKVMAGHEYCTADPWVHGPSIDFPIVDESILPNANPSPFHPTSAGQRAIYEAVRAALTN